MNFSDFSLKSEGKEVERYVGNFSGGVEIFSGDGVKFF